MNPSAVNTYNTSLLISEISGNTGKLWSRIFQFLPAKDFSTVFSISKFFSTVAVETKLACFLHYKYKEKASQATEAERLVRKLQKSAPNHFLIPCVLGEIERVRHRILEASDYFKKLEGLRVHPEDFYLAQGRLGIYYDWHDDQETALQLLQESYSEYPDDPLVRSYLGNLFSEIDPVTAREFVENAYEQDPHDYLVVLNSSSFCTDSSQMKRRLEAVLKEFPKCLSISYLLAEQERRSRTQDNPNVYPNAYIHYTNALSNEVLSREKWYGYALARRATLCLRTDLPGEMYNLDEIQRDLETAKRDFPTNSEILRECAVAFSSRSENFKTDYKEATVCLEAVIRHTDEAKKAGEAAYLLGLLHQSGGYGLTQDLDVARNWFERALKYQPTHTKARAAYDALKVVNKKTSPEVHPSQWIDSPPGLEEITKELTQYLASSYSQKKQLESCVEELVETFAQVAPLHALVPLCRGESCLMKQDLQGATKQFRRLQSYADFPMDTHAELAKNEVYFFILSRFGIGHCLTPQEQAKKQAIPYLQKACSHREDPLTTTYLYYAAPSQDLARRIVAAASENVDHPSIAACSADILLRDYDASSRIELFNKALKILEDAHEKFPKFIQITYLLAEVHRELLIDFDKAYNYYTLVVQDTALEAHPRYLYSMARRSTLVLSHAQATDEQKKQAVLDLQVAGASKAPYIIKECSKGIALVREDNKVKEEWLTAKPASPQKASEIAARYIEQKNFIAAKQYLETACRANRDNPDPLACRQLLTLYLNEVVEKKRDLGSVQEFIEYAWQVYETTQDSVLKTEIDRALLMA